MDAKSWIQEIRAAGKLMAAGDLAGAENRYRQLLDKGTDNPLHKALALDGLGRAVFEQGRQAEAIEAIEAAVSLLRERQGVQDPATCGALQNLGRLYLAAGQVEKSIAVSREAVDGLRAGFGEDHPLVAGAMMRLSACLYMQRDLDGAEALLLKARDVFEKQSGDESRMDVSTCLNNLGRIHEERGDLEQGIALHGAAGRPYGNGLLPGQPRCGPGNGRSVAGSRGYPAGSPGLLCPCRAYHRTGHRRLPQES